MTQQLTAKQEEWLQMLESGDYEQYHNGLGCYNEEEGTKAYCCLGIVTVYLGGGEWINGQLHDDKSDVELTKNHVKELNLHSSLGSFDEDQVTSSQQKMLNDKTSHSIHALDEMNDHNFSFQEIAEFIRINPAVVFVN